MGRSTVALTFEVYPKLPSDQVFQTESQNAEVEGKCLGPEIPPTYSETAIRVQLRTEGTESQESQCLMSMFKFNAVNFLCANRYNLYTEGITVCIFVYVCVQRRGVTIPKIQ